MPTNSVSYNERPRSSNLDYFSFGTQYIPAGQAPPTHPQQMLPNRASQDPITHMRLDQPHPQQLHEQDDSYLKYNPQIKAGPAYQEPRKTISNQSGAQQEPDISRGIQQQEDSKEIRSLSKAIDPTKSK
jgi:hypothetical protein